MRTPVKFRFLFSTVVFGLSLIAGDYIKAQTFTTIYSFTGGNDGYNPNGLVLGSDGSLYGTTSNGGTNSAGTVFKIGPGGILTSLYSFTGGNDGANPAASLIQGSDGDFYGTTFNGGSVNAGTVFKIRSSGGFTNLYSFPGGADGANPQAALVQGNDGSFYGTTFSGGGFNFFGGFSGTSTNGTVFEISKRGAITGLYPFAFTNGANPVAGLVQGSNGVSFYGTTQSGGANNSGCVFEVPSPLQPPRRLYSFTGGSDGANPFAGLVQGSDGYFYGTTAYGGTGNSGTVFRFNPSTTMPNQGLTTLYSFSGGVDGANPYGALVLGSDGYFYGTTQTGGTNGGEGTIFRISAKGTYTSLYSFSGGNDGSNPQAALVQGLDGSFYGTTVNGGTYGAGSVFKLTVPLAGPPQLAITSAGTNVILTWTNTAIGYTLQATTNLGSTAVWTTNLPSPVVVNGQFTVTNAVSGTQQFFRLSQ